MFITTCPPAPAPPALPWGMPTGPLAGGMRIIAGMGAGYGPYTGQHFASRRDTDIKHMVATSEAYPIFATPSHNVTLHQIVTMFQNSEWH